jgi:hypothetical protein
VRQAIVLGKISSLCVCARARQAIVLGKVSSLYVQASVGMIAVGALVAAGKGVVMIVVKIVVVMIARRASRCRYRSRAKPSIQLKSRVKLSMKM